MPKFFVDLISVLFLYRVSMCACRAAHIMVVIRERVVNIYLRHATEEKMAPKIYDVRVESAS